MNDKKWLMDKILEFMSILDDCLRSTTYADDRPIYTNDLAVASAWLIKLYKGVCLVDIYNDIISDHTSKQFTDYWRQGLWGETESRAITALQGDIRQKFKIIK
jgi:hypothetical protein